MIAGEGEDRKDSVGMAHGEELHDHGILEAPEPKVFVVKDTVDPGLNGFRLVPKQVVDRHQEPLPFCFGGIAERNIENRLRTGPTIDTGVVKATEGLVVERRQALRSQSLAPHGPLSLLVLVRGSWVGAICPELVGENLEMIPAERLLWSGSSTFRSLWPGSKRLYRLERWLEYRSSFNDCLPQRTHGECCLEVDLPAEQSKTWLDRAVSIGGIGPGRFMNPWREQLT